jgi:3-phenylpropionate/trans-cinnamate dioxygenase ferredoxin reductase subunit
MRRVVIVGASVAGLTAAETLREDGFAGDIVLVNGERHAGYDRPPLSKALLSGRLQASDLALRPTEFHVAHSIDHRVGVRAEAMDLSNRAVLLDNGERIGFDGAIIATGLRARPLPGQPPFAGVHLLRTLDDAERLRASLLACSNVVVVGGGFLGSEVAATARELGRSVTIVDPLELPLRRQLGADVAARVVRTHVDKGVALRLQRVVRSFHEKNGRVAGVTLDDNEHLAAEVVMVAIGSIPNTEWLRPSDAGNESGLELDDGVVCDEFCRAAEGIYAAGDVARWRHPRFGSLRVEHRMHATVHAIAAAHNLLGARVPFDPLPYFWTDFYDVKVQVFGFIGPDDTMTLLSGDPGGRSFTAGYARDGTITAVLGWNAPREVRRQSSLVGQRVDAMPSRTAAHVAR